MCSGTEAQHAVVRQQFCWYLATVNELLLGLLSVLLATNQAIAASNLVSKTVGVSAKIKAADTNDPVEREFQKILAEDDASQAEVDEWIRSEEKFGEKGAGIPKVALELRIRQRFEPVEKLYTDFLERHPKHKRAFIAYGSFLNDNYNESGARKQWEKALELDPKDPAIYNNLANIYGHKGPVEKAFDYYAKAIELQPNEPVYYHNFGTTVFLFRKHAMEHYKITEQEVFNRALELYRKGIKLDPDNFPLAADIANTYYGIKPARTEDAIAAWNEALKIAHDDVERQGVFIHLARLKTDLSRFDDARAHLEDVTLPMYNDLKVRVTKRLEDKKKKVREKSFDPTNN